MQTFDAADELTNLNHLYLTHLRQAQIYGREIAKHPNLLPQYRTAVGQAQNAIGPVLAYAKRAFGQSGFDALDEAAANQGDFMRRFRALSPTAQRHVIGLHEGMAEFSDNEAQMEALVCRLLETMQQVKREGVAA